MSDKLTLGEVVDQLRSAQPLRRLSPTVEQVRVLLDDIEAMVPLEVTAARPVLSAFSVSDLADIAAAAGAARGRALKQARVKHKRVSASKSQTLFLVPESAAREARRKREAREARQAARARARKPRAVKGALPLFDMDEAASTPSASAGPSVADEVRGQRAARSAVAAQRALLGADAAVLPPGYDPASLGRNVSASLDALLSAPMNDREIERFVRRTYSVPGAQLEADHVMLLWWLMCRGMADKLLELLPETTTWVDSEGVERVNDRHNVRLAHLMVKAFDVLEDARADAEAVLHSLSSDAEPEELADALEGMSWVSPEVMRLARLARQRVERGGPSLDRVCRSRVASFAAEFARSPGGVLPEDVACLSEAQVRRLVAVAGLATDEEEERVFARDVRGQLVEMGLKHDLEFELPEAVRAWRSGSLEEYLASRQARCDGDPDWESLYVPAVALER